MAKQPSANPPVRRFAFTPRPKLFFLVLSFGLTFLLLLGFGLNQLATVQAQTATPVLAFAPQTVGTMSGSQNSTFTNTNDGSPMTVSPALATGTDFSISNNGCAGQTLSFGDSCPVGVVFSPKSAGAKTDSLIFTYAFVSSGASKGDARANSEAQAASAQISNTRTTNLTGTGLAVVPPTSTPVPPTATPVPPTSTPVPPTATPVPPTATATRSAPACGSQIHGWVLVDGKPGVGQMLKLEGPSNAQLTIGPDGFFYFNNLCAGDYKVSLVYDHTKYMPVDPDTRTFKVDGVNAYRDNQFSLKTITTTAPTTAVPTTSAPVTTSAPGTTAAPTTTAPAAPQCPANIVTPPTDNRLRLGTQTIKVTDTSFLLCVQVAAGNAPVDLNDTVIINLPGGSVVSQANANLGTVTVNTNTVRWGGFSLAAQQTANLVLSINSPGGSLNGSSIFVSGRFNRSQAFQQRIPGLPGLTDIEPPSQGGQGGGTQGESGPAVIPSSAPATGVGAEEAQASSLLIIVLGVIAAASVGIFGLFMTGRATKRPNNKEQK